MKFYFTYDKHILIPKRMYNINNERNKILTINYIVDLPAIVVDKLLSIKFMFGTPSKIKSKQ